MTPLPGQAQVQAKEQTKAPTEIAQPKETASAGKSEASNTTTPPPPPPLSCELGVDDRPERKQTESSDKSKPADSAARPENAAAREKPKALPRKICGGQPRLPAKASAAKTLPACAAAPAISRPKSEMDACQQHPPRETPTNHTEQGELRQSHSSQSGQGERRPQPSGEAGRGNAAALRSRRTPPAPPPEPPERPGSRRRSDDDALLEFEERA